MSGSVGVGKEMLSLKSPKNNAQIPDELEAMKKAVNDILDSNGLPLLDRSGNQNFFGGFLRKG